MNAEDPAVRTWEDTIERGLAGYGLASPTLGSLEEKLDQLRQEYNALLIELGEVRAAADRNVGRLAHAHSELGRVVRERDGVRAELARMAAENEDLRAENRALRARLKGGE